MRWALTLLLLACGCADAPVVDDGPPPWVNVPAIVDAGTPTWPMPNAPLTQLALPKAPRRYRILVDAGHGAPGNHGNTSLHCEKESDVMREVAFGLATRLSLMGPFDVRLSRDGDEEPSYAARKKLAEDWPADAVISLHSDVRGDVRPWIESDCTSVRNDARPGFSVLWSSEGGSAIAEKRRGLAWSMTSAMTQAGFKPYAGDEYGGLYVEDAGHVGAFMNDETSHRRIWFLRKLRVPTIIIETHHALDYEEVARWREMRTRNLFAFAVARGLLDYFDQGH